MTRRKQRSGPDGLWKWTPTGIERAEIRDNPLRRPCGHCHATVGSPCTRPTKRGRVALDSYHPARTEQPEETQ